MKVHDHVIGCYTICFKYIICHVCDWKETSLRKRIFHMLNLFRKFMHASEYIFQWPGIRREQFMPFFTRPLSAIHRAWPACRLVSQPRCGSSSRMRSLWSRRRQSSSRHTPYQRTQRRLGRNSRSHPPPPGVLRRINTCQSDYKLETLTVNADIYPS